MELDDLYLDSLDPALRATLELYQSQGLFEDLEVRPLFVDYEPAYVGFQSPSEEFTYEPPKDYAEGIATIVLAASGPLTFAYWFISSLLDK